MTGTLAHIWRYPIKAHGYEALKQVVLTTGKTIPWDREWAVAHEAAKTDGRQWVPCVNFSRGAKAPELMAISATLDEAQETITLTHPKLPDLNFSPDTEAAKFLEWVRPLMPENRAASSRIIRVRENGMTDSDFPSISLNNLATNAEIGQKIGADLSPLRWRGNLWFQNLKPWEEFDWVSKRVRIGSVELYIKERIGRCLATAVNPDTGKRDADTLKILKENWGHTQFGVYGVVLNDGQINIGDKIQVL